MELTEDQAIELAVSPHKIIDAYTCNVVIGFLNGHISDMALAEWEAELIANQHEVNLLHTEGKTNAVARAEFKVSEPYKNWKQIKLELQKFRAYRYDLRKKEESLKNSSQYTRKTYDRVI